MIRTNRYVPHTLAALAVVCVFTGDPGAGLLTAIAGLVYWGANSA